MTLEEKRAVLLRAAEAGYFTEAIRAAYGRQGALEAVAPLAASLLGEHVAPGDLVVAEDYLVAKYGRFWSYAFGDARA